MTDAQAAPAAEAANSVSPARGAGPTARSRTKGDVPQVLLDRYLVERDLRGRAERYFRDHRSAEPVFRDRGGSLVAGAAYPDAVADMLKIARHRGWTQVRVAGDEAFRREVWVQAQPLGLEVRGHRPKERDRQAAQAAPAKPDPQVQTPAPATTWPDRLQRAAVVVARLIPDPVIQARLLAGAHDRLNLDRSSRDRSVPQRDRRR